MPKNAARGAEGWLDWYALMGVVDAVEEEPPDRYRSPPAAAARAPVAPPPPPGLVGPAALTGPKDALRDARALARACTSLAALEAALAGFEGCSLRATATRLCFADGNPQAPLMLIGEAPGAEEDRQGKPFVGQSGQLLDRMLAAIGLDRHGVYITNVIYWRPPGNRAPTATEIAVCQPFLERQIELLRPRLMVFVGGIAARALLGQKDGVTRLRGRRFAYQPAGDAPPVPALVMFHPAYLLRQPAQKRFAWRDMLTIRLELERLVMEPGGPVAREAT